MIEDLKNFTIGDFFEALEGLEPHLQLIAAVEKFKADSEYWQKEAKRKDLLLRTIINERDEALKRLAILQGRG